MAPIGDDCLEREGRGMAAGSIFEMERGILLQLIKKIISSWPELRALKPCFEGWHYK